MTNNKFWDAVSKTLAAVTVTLAGGYARRVEDTVTIHANTAKAAAEVCAKI